jgi:hypothetical protein
MWMMEVRDGTYLSTLYDTRIIYYIFWTGLSVCLSPFLEVEKKDFPPTSLEFHATMNAHYVATDRLHQSDKSVVLYVLA